MRIQIATWHRENLGEEKSSVFSTRKFLKVKLQINILTQKSLRPFFVFSVGKKNHTSLSNDNHLAATSSGQTRRRVFACVVA